MNAKSLLIFSSLSLVLLTNPAIGQTSDDPASKLEVSIEKQIALQVETNLAAALAELETVVNINSGTMNFLGVKTVGHFFIEQLAALGLATEWQDGAAFGRAGHVVASKLSTNPSAPKILLIGHLDTVFAADDVFQKFERLDQNHIAGPGITDMKGGDLIIVHALRALTELGLLDRISVKVVLTGDEESSGKPLSASKKALSDAADWADIALGFEDGDSNIETAVIARRSASTWQLNVTGKPAHSSQIFQQDIGSGAIFETARILNEFRETLAGTGNLTFNPGLIIGGTTLDNHAQADSGNAFGKSNVIAKTAQVTGGIRALSQAELQNAQDVMQSIAGNNLPHTSATLVFNEGYPPLAPSEGNRQLLEMYSSVSQSLGYGPVQAVNPRNAGAADISFTAGKVTMALDGLGLMGRGGHTKDEVADISSFKKNIQKAAILLYRLSNDQSIAQ